MGISCKLQSVCVLITDVKECVADNEQPAVVMNRCVDGRHLIPKPPVADVGQCLQSAVHGM